MIHRKVLDHKGCTADRLRAIFTCKDETHADFAIKKRFQNRIKSRLPDGVTRCAKRSQIWRAVDIAWDSTPIQPQTIPLLLWAQKKIKMENLVKDLDKLQLAEQFIKPGKAGAMVVDMPRLYEVSINLIRSYITRRQAAQTARYSNIWPYFRYEPRGTDLIAKLRSDALSQRMDVMVDAYNYRHFWPQTFRHQFMYSRSVAFVRSAWDKVIGWKAKDLNLPAGDIELESYTEREGVDFVAPHPTRVFFDTSAPLPNINTDNGPCYIGYWDIVPYRVIRDGPFFNTEAISVGDGLVQLMESETSFFRQYFDCKLLDSPQMEVDPSAGNDRTRQTGRYSTNDSDKGCFLSQYYEKINPCHEKICDLNVEVWVRLSVAGDHTVVGGEFLTSRPACYGGYNENDDREVNASMATDLMAIQDQLTNLYSQMLQNIRAGMLQIWAIDTDALDSNKGPNGEPSMRDHIENTLKSKDYYSEPKAFFYSGEKLRSLGVQNPADNSRAFLSIIQANVQTSIEQSMRAIGDLLAMADKLTMMSPNEQGQPNPREVAAREVTEISTTTNSISSFVSDGIDEQRAAAKKICFESLICESTSEYSVAVMDRYTAQTITDAGFKFKGEFKPGDLIPLKTSIIGTPASLAYDYYFDSRDGAERGLNSQGAQVMATLLSQFMQMPVLAKAFGKKRLFEWANEITRMSGAAIDLNLQLLDGESDSLAEGPELEERVAQIEAMLQKLAGPPAGGAAPEALAPAPSAIDSAPQPPEPAPGSPEEVPAELREA